MSVAYDQLTNVVSKATRTGPIGSSRRSHVAILARLEDRWVHFALAHSSQSIRISLAIVFMWFGLQKLVQPATVFNMVIGTTDWFPLPPEFLLPAMGAVEVIMGFAFLCAGGVLLRLALHFLVLHMLATFVVLALMPDVSFHKGNPLLLTNAGEYVIKNLVLIASGLVLLAGTTDSEKRANGHIGGPIRNTRMNGAQSTAIIDGDAHD